jgi:isopenicillin-N epimerase
MTEYSAHWTLDPEITFLNHGSFGACPKSVLEKQSQIRQRIESQPVQFFLRDVYDLIDDARRRVADFVDGNPEQLVFVRNATEGVNAILQSVDFKPGDEILVTNHGYPACKNAVDYIARRSGALVRIVEIPFTDVNHARIHELVMAATHKRTRLALIDHVTSPTGLVLPIESLVPALEDRGIMTLIDGAHGPGMLPLSMNNLNASWYVGNFHKWVCAPKGAGMLYAREDRIKGLHPSTISHGFSLNPDELERPRLHLEFDWVGTQDPSAWLCVPHAIDTLASMVQGGWDEIRTHCRRLTLEGRNHLMDILSVEQPASDECIGQLAALPLPPSDEKISALYGSPLQERLLNEYGIEVPIVSWPKTSNRLVRISGALYNTAEQYDRLGSALEAVLSC